jgi:hypothetical protein
MIKAKWCMTIKDLNWFIKNQNITKNKIISIVGGSVRDITIFYWED